MARLVQLDMEADFIGKAALQRIRDEGVKRKQVGLILDGEPLSGPNTQFWTVYSGAEIIGKVTSAIYSPRLKNNIALAMVNSEYSEIDTQLQVDQTTGISNARVVECPFFDPKKKLVAS